MKCIHLTTHKLYQPHQKTPLRLALISDLHFSYQLTDAKLTGILHFLRQLQPDYILSPGDLIDSADMVDAPSERQRLLAWLEQLTTIAPFIFSYGNHDHYRKNPQNLKSWITDYNTAFFQAASAIPNLHLLDNSSYQDKNLYVLGLTPSPAYYNTPDLTASQPPTHSESKLHLLHLLTTLDSTLLHPKKSPSPQARPLPLPCLPYRPRNHPLFHQLQLPHLRPHAQRRRPSHP